MAPLGPFGQAPRLAAGVSGGPHSCALALLARDWVVARGGRLLALIVDHGLRPESGAEAAQVGEALAARGIEARVLRLALDRGAAGVQARARAARLAALAEAASAAGAPWLLLGHHRGDQAETLLHRAAAGSGPAGLAAMAPVRPLRSMLLLRPLLDVPPARLEALLVEAGLSPVRDPSNADARFARVRLRQALGDPAGTGPQVAALAVAAAAFGRGRARAERMAAERLAAAVVMHPEGWAEIDPSAFGRDGVAAAALAALIRTVGGERFAPAPGQVAALLRRGEGTLGGAWLARAGQRLRLVREPAGAMAACAVAARSGALWDGRFRMVGPGEDGLEVAALGPAGAVRIGGGRGLPAGLRAGLPAIRRPGGPLSGGDAHSALVAVPALLYPDPDVAARFAMVFAPVSGPVT